MRAGDATPTVISSGAREFLLLEEVRGPTTER
jgi:hypothetical protein